MRILIIGGTRFMGPFVARRLRPWATRSPFSTAGRPRATCRPRSSTCTARISISAPGASWSQYLPALRELAPEVVLDMIPMTEAAVRVTQEVLRGVARRLVVVSSMDVYRAYGVLIGKETGELDPLPDYRGFTRCAASFIPTAASRRAAQTMRGAGWTITIRSRSSGSPCRTRDLPGTVLRLPMVYGPGDGQHRLFEYLKRMDDRRPFILLDAGPGGLAHDARLR